MMSYVVQAGGQLAGGAMMAVGAWLMALGAVDAQNIGVGAVGVALLGAGMALVKWTLKTSERVEATYVGAITAAEERAARSEKAEEQWRHLYEQERELRMSLEKAGVTDRRKSGRQE